MTSLEQAAADKAAQQLIKEDIETYGWHVVLMGASSDLPAHAHTIGLYEKFKHPEIIIFGLPLQTMHDLLNEVGGMISEGHSPALDTDHYDLLEKYPVRFCTVDRSNVDDYFTYAQWYYKNLDFPAVQMVWTDMEGFYPWQEDFNQEIIYLQPVLNKKIDYKFLTPKNTTAYTTRQILEQGKPILVVSHDREGDWQFLHGEGESLDDAMMIALGDVVKLDPTVNDLFSLETGEMATRKFVGDAWVFEEMVEDDDEEI